MTTASEQAASHLTAASATNKSDDRPTTSTRPATGDYARLREYVLEKDDLTEEEEADFAELVAASRAGTLVGRPPVATRKRRSVAGDNDRDGHSGRNNAPTTKTASEIAGESLGRSF